MPSPNDIEGALRIEVEGRVQGVGFRPHVWRLAVDLGLAGWVRNEMGRVLIHVEGREADLSRFRHALLAAAPPLARPRLRAIRAVAPERAAEFRIEASEPAAEADIHVPPDLFCCADCLAELRTPGARRFRYPFTNCTQCGPRYTLIAALPYDRANTAMARFELCVRCRAEYADPADRRFHAEPLACPDCGPRLRFEISGAGREDPRKESEDPRKEGQAAAFGEAALRAAVDLLRAGGIVAVKGIGGYHLMCDARNDAALRALRQRKQRPRKPLAVMFPLRGADGLDAVRAYLVPSAAEEAALADPARPIVLVPKSSASGLGAEVAPGLAEVGAFLPYSPLHHLLLDALGFPLVATSANVSGEPVITEDDAARRRLSAIADGFLHHDRPILRPADDPVVRVIGGAARTLRLGRGLAPLERDLASPLAAPVLAVGGHLKNTIALGWERRAVVSPHVGDLESPRARDVFAQVIDDLCRLYRVDPAVIAADAHPRYASSRWAAARGLPLLRIPHHEAHASALAGEHPGIGDWLVFTWDGLGLGERDELWGGEAFLGAPGRWRRVASLRLFHLAGGERAGREPWRAAAALMWEAGFDDFQPRVPEAALARQAWERRLNTHPTSSAGRLFDAAASLVLGLDQASFEGEGPMLLESMAEPGLAPLSLPLAPDPEGVLRLDWRPLLPLLTCAEEPAARRAGLFHASLAAAICETARRVAESAHFEAVGLTGGVFQNRLLTEEAFRRLDAAGFAVHLPAALPPNDGGLAFGQLVEAAARMAREGWPARREE